MAAETRTRTSRLSWIKHVLRAIFPVSREQWSPVPGVAAVVVVIVVGFATIVGYAAQLAGGVVLSVISLASMLGLAAMLAGGLLGFVFGIPRALQDSAVAATIRPMASNTNLEQISDWLTKILVGVGLTQIRELPGLARDLAAYVAPGLGNLASSPVFALALLTYFGTAGFLIGYLVTRLILPSAFSEAERPAPADEEMGKTATPRPEPAGSPGG